VTLASGTQFSRYEIRSQLGIGGMGEVYRARDNRLNRDVAIKVLLDSCLRDPERMARCELDAWQNVKYLPFRTWQPPKKIKAFDILSHFLPSRIRDVLLFLARYRPVGILNR
jgi:hypothetical protein